MSLDSHACQRTVTASLADRGVIPTWEELIRPVLVAIGERWAQTSRGVEIEHSFSMVVVGALAAHSARLERPRNGRPAVLASAPEELHDLPLMVLQAALSDVGIRSHVIGARTPEEALRDAVDAARPPGRVPLGADARCARPRAARESPGDDAAGRAARVVRRSGRRRITWLISNTQSARCARRWGCDLLG